MPLEGLWWTDNMSLFTTDNKDIWKWTAMIMQPEYVTRTLFDNALRQVEKKKKLPGISKVRKHHEIYLSDFRKTAPDKLKTIIRQPVKLISSECE